MNKKFGSMMLSLLMLLFLSGCVPDGSKSSSMISIYAITTILSLALLIGCTAMIRKRDKWFILLFSSVFIVNAGYLLLALAAVGNQLSLLYFSLTMGGVVVNKNKAIAGVGIYFIAEFVIEGIVQGITTVLSFSGMLVAGDWAMVFLPYLIMLVYGAFAVGFSLFNKHLLTHKLNLS